eukprot:g22437.t1
MANCHEHELQTSASEWHAECQQLRAEMVSRERRDRRIRIVLVIAFVLIALVAYFQEEHKISDLKKEGDKLQEELDDLKKGLIEHNITRSSTTSSTARPSSTLGISTSEAFEGPHAAHQDQKSFCDRCIVCLGPRYVTLLTEEERDAVWHMRRQVVNNPKPEDAELQKQVLLLWNTAFPDEKLDLFEKGQGWKKLGFQGTDPSTDVRTGSWPLEQLVALATHHPTEFCLHQCYHDIRMDLGR